MWFFVLFFGHDQFYVVIKGCGQKARQITACQGNAAHGGAQLSDVFHRQQSHLYGVADSFHLKCIDCHNHSQ